MRIFSSVQSAVAAGFHVWDRTQDGSFLVRILTPKGYALALAKGN
jgi:hypothetical protein